MRGIINLMRSDRQSITFYDILGVTSDASDEDVKRAYRRLAKKMHPDAGGTAQHMHLLNRAYEALKTQSNRAHYDLTISSSTVEQSSQPAEDSSSSQEETLQLERQMVAKAKEGARRTLFSGVLVLILGIIITAVTYNMAGAGGTYIIMTGSILWGGVAIFRGWYHLLNPFRLLHKALDKDNQKYNFLLEKGNEGAKAFSIIIVCCLFMVIGLASISNAAPSSTSSVSNPVSTPSAEPQDTNSSTTDSSSSAPTPNTSNSYSPPSMTGVAPLNTTAQQHCGPDQTGVYPDCLSPAPHLHCSGITTGDYTSYNCSDQTGKLFCTGSIIGGVASNTCDSVKGAPYTCQNNSLDSIVSIDCTGTSYIDNPTIY